MSRAVEVPSMVVLLWIDKKSVHFLSTSAATCEASASRRPRGGALHSASCTRSVADYHLMMGGIDRNDKLRLQAYSLQTSFRFKQYYKILFVSMFDLAKVNAYVTHRVCAQQSGVVMLSRAEFMTQLLTQLIAVKLSGFASATNDPMPARRSPLSRVAHTLALNDEWRGTDKDSKHRHNSCMVFSPKFRVPGKRATRPATTAWSAQRIGSACSYARTSAPRKATPRQALLFGTGTGTASRQLPPRRTISSARRLARESASLCGVSSTKSQRAATTVE